MTQPRKRKHRCTPACERTRAEWKHLGGNRHRITRLRYVKDFDDRKQKRVDRALDRVSQALSDLLALGVEARVSYGKHP